jgi:ABC-type Zn uptake system ZnuABC Zn-binding protein ZnuA/ABC-type Mn2+/Zn2+ transport system permease subunit
LLEPFQLPFVQRGLIEVLILAVPAGLLGTWIVLRGLAFFSHAVGTAAFPGLVLADGLGFAPPLGAFVAATAFSAGNSALRRRRGEGGDSVVAIVLVACLATGVILASDVFGSGANVETLLFGSLLLVDDGDIALAAAAAAATLLASLLVGHRWLQRGFDAEAPGSTGRSAALLDALLLGLIALATTAALSVVGALLVAALFVVPAITARLLTRRMLSWQLASVALVAVEGTVGLWLSVKTDAPPGATIACVSGAAFALVAAARALARTSRPALPALAATLALALLAAGCGGSGRASDGRLEVVATTTVLGDWVRAVGGNAVAVDQVLEPNTDPHQYEPRPSDVEGAAGAALVFANGDGLDSWIEEVVSDSGSDAEIVDLGAVVPDRLPGEEEGDATSDFDPHWWHDPRNAEAAVAEIERRLAAADPARRRLFERNAERYLARLRALDRGIARCIDAVPAARRKLVTDHDALGYFARRYGIEVVGAVIPSQTTEAQPSAKDLAELARTVEEEGVSAIFPESSLSPKLAEAIARQTGASADRTLYGDSLGPEGSAGATYLGMEAANADAMVAGFTDGRRGCRLSR